MLDEAFSLRCTLSDMEQSSLYYISGYVAKKEHLTIHYSVDVDQGVEYPCSEFTTLLSRGNLTHPPPELFELSCILYCYYKNVEKTCVKHLLHAFGEIYECSQVSYPQANSILRRFVNCFAKAFSKQETAKLAEEKQKNNIKRTRLSFQWLRIVVNMFSTFCLPVMFM